MFRQVAKELPLIEVNEVLGTHRSAWYLKRYSLPALYWNLLLKGRA
jgi:sulfide:quinone oxidoreductase